MIKKKYSEVEGSIVNMLTFIDKDRYPIDKIKTVTFQVTTKCNLACTYCYQNHKGCSDDLTFEEAKTFIDALFNNEYKKVANIDEIEFFVFEFIGGEPFIAVDLMYDISKYIEKKILLEHPKFIGNHMYSISTNGTLYFTPKVQKYFDTFQGMVSTSVTVDGAKETHDACRIYADSGKGSYDDAHAAALDAASRYNQKGTKMTLAPANIATLADSFKYFYNEGYTEIHMNCVYEDVWNNIEDIRLLYHQTLEVANWLLENELKISCGYLDNMYHHIDEDTPNWCGGTKGILCVAPGGKMYPCQRFSEVSISSETQEPLIIGTTAGGLLATDKERENLASLDNVTAWSCSDEECRACPIASSCGYCSAWNYEVYGTVAKRTKFTCDTQRVRYLVSYQYYWIATLENKDIQWGSQDMSENLLLDDAMIEMLVGTEECAKIKALEQRVKEFKKN